MLFCESLAYFWISFENKDFFISEGSWHAKSYYNMHESLRNGFNPKDLKVVVRTPSKGKDTIIHRPRPGDLNQIQNYTGNIYKIRSVPILPDAKYISRTCPKKIVTDKERLYEENLNLKQMYNYVNEENLKMRTKILQLEKNAEQSKNHESSTSSQKNSHLIDSLKNNIKDLRIEIKAKDKEIEDMKRYIRYTKMQELEADLMQYMNECNRLKGIVDELLEEKGIIPEGVEIYENLKNEVMDAKSELLKKNEIIEELNSKVEELAKNEEELKANLKESEKIKGFEKSLEKKNHKILLLEAEVGELKEEIQNFQLISEFQNDNQGKGKVLLGKIREFLSSHQIAAGSWVKSITSQESLSKSEFFAALEQDSIDFTSKEFEEFWFFHSTDQRVLSETLISLFTGEEIEKLDINNLFQIFKARATYQGVQNISKYIFERLPTKNNINETDLENFCNEGIFLLEHQSHLKVFTSHFLQNPEKKESLTEKLGQKFSDWSPLKRVEIEGMLKRFQSLLFECYDEIIARLQEATQFQSVISFEKFIDELRVFGVFETHKEELCVRAGIYMFSRSVNRVSYLGVINMFYQCDLQSEFLSNFGKGEEVEGVRRSIHSSWIEDNESGIEINEDALKQSIE